MVQPVFANRLTVQDSQSVSISQIICQTLWDTIHKIYQFVIDLLNFLFCNLLAQIVKTIEYSDPISEGLACFDNATVQGQVNGIYITTNETELDLTREYLRQHPPLRNRQMIHIGCATWHNFDLIVQRRSTYGLIFDFNPKNAEFIQKTMDLICGCNTREAFKNAITEYLNSLQGSERHLFFHWDQRGNLIDRIEQEFFREGSWLESDESYQFIKNELVMKNRLIPITENIQNFENFLRIRQFLDAQGVVIDTVYLSNICNFMRTPNAQENFVRSLRYLLRDETILVSCPKLRQGAEEIILRQKAILGREILAEDYDASQLFQIQ